MVGKPNLPADAEQRSDVRGAARGTPGLTALDEEREASMADEGGASGMAVESERPRLEVDEFEESWPGTDLLVVGGIFALGALAGLCLARLLRGR
jgi:hypothetical protein